jgi:hypothetical protein
MFLFGAVQEYPIFDQNRDSFDTERTRNGHKRQKTNHPIRKSSILCCSVFKFFEPSVSQFWAMKETNIKN